MNGAAFAVNSPVPVSPSAIHFDARPGRAMVPKRAPVWSDEGDSNWLKDSLRRSPILAAGQRHRARTRHVGVFR